MRTTKTTLVTVPSGANLAVVGESKHRLRLEFHYAMSSSVVFLLDKPMTATNSGIVLTSTITTKVFTKEEHGDLVCRAWNGWGSAANNIVVVETFENAN